MTIQCVSVGGEQAGKLNGSRGTNQRSIVIVQAGGHIGVYEGGNYLGDGTWSILNGEEQELKSSAINIGMWETGSMGVLFISLSRFEANAVRFQTC